MLLQRFTSSYQAGLVQAKAFRVLKKRTNDALRRFNLSATEWGVLGVLVEQRRSMTFKEVASEVGVKAPVVTKSIKHLCDLGHVTVNRSRNDTRVKHVAITPAGRHFIKATEPIVMKEVLKTFRGISKRNLLGYVMTLSAIIDSHYSRDVEAVDLDHMHTDA